MGSHDRPNSSFETPTFEKNGKLEQAVAAVPMGRIGTPDGVANAAAFLASDDSSYVIGIELCVDGGAAQVEAMRAAPRVEVRDQGVLQWTVVFTYLAQGFHGGRRVRRNS